MRKTSVFLMIVLLTTGLLPARQVAASAPHQDNPPYTLFLPTVIDRYITVFGIETHAMDTSVTRPLQEAGSTWTRRNAIVWSQVEPQKGNRNWAVLTQLENDLINASRNGIEVILIVRGAPKWARQYPNSECGAIRSSEMGSFASFMSEAVSRYSRSPYNVKYWEIGNEPDVPTGETEDQAFGCWGNYGEAYFGGGTYANLLKQVYPAIKTADPASQVLIGGLLLDCDPSNPPEITPGVLKDCTPGNFMEGILKNGGGPYFDAVAFHSYDYYWGEHTYINPNWHSSWDTTGPAITAKVTFLRNLLATYGVSGKYLLSTESALLCSNTCGDMFEETQAIYLAQSYAVSLRLGLTANVWYDWNGSWRNSGLTRQNGSLRPAYLAFKFASQELGRAAYVSDLTQEGVRGYEFRRGSVRIWFVNTTAGNQQSFQLPGTPAAIYDVYGNPLPVSTNLTLDNSPIYIEW